MAGVQIEKPLTLSEQYHLEKEKKAEEAPPEAAKERTEATPATESSAEDASAAAPGESSESAGITLETAPADFRFPTQNQTRHCYSRYIEYHRCTAVKGEGAPECDRFAKYYRALCPGEWVEKWNEQRENGTFSGPL